MIIDAQIHCWEGSPQYPAPERFRQHHGRERFTVEEALAAMDAIGVDRTILVPVGTWPTGPTKNGYSLDAARRYPGRFAVMGQFEYDSPARAKELATWKQQPGMLGVRRWFSPDVTPLADGSLDWFFAALVEHDVPLMASAPGNMRLFAPILKKYTGLRLIIDHAGRVPWGLDEVEVWADLEDTLALAKFPSVAIKVSSLPCFSSKPYPFPALHEPIRRIYDSFGPQRMLWGSDLTRLRWTYADNLRLFQEGLDFLSADDREWILGKAAAKACGWPI